MVKVPANLSYYDTLQMPVVLKNNTNKAIKGTLIIEAIDETFDWINELPTDVKIAANETKVIYTTTIVKEDKGQHLIEVGFDNNGLSDRIQQIEVNPKGFDHHFSFWGIEKTGKDTFILENIYDGSLESTLTIYPDILDGLIDGVESIFRKPYGCFEQVSSSNYPNILALKILENFGTSNPQIAQKAKEYIKSGYQKLAAYEIEGGGFELFGHPPANEGLSAYGLVQFENMKKVYPEVDQAMINRTKNYLLKRRDGKGGYHLAIRGYDGFHGSRPTVFNAYITWTLAKTGTKGIEKEITTATLYALQTQDIYLLSLACLTNFHVGNTTTAQQLLSIIEKSIDSNNLEKVKADMTLTNSWGNSNTIETLSFAAQAMMQSKKANQALLIAIVKYIHSKRVRGKYGSTQATVLAMQTLADFRRYNAHQREDKTVVLFLDGKKVLEKTIQKGDIKKLVLGDLAQYLQLWQNTLEIVFDGKSQEGLPYSFETAWKSPKPDDAATCPIHIATQLQETTVKMGQNVRLNIHLQNQLHEAISSPMAIIGIPAGLSLQPWQLKELQEKNSFDYYEIKDNFLYLYYRGMPAQEKRTIHLDLKPEIPGYYSAPASSTYLYYMDEHVDWEQGVSVRIVE